MAEISKITLPSGNTYDIKDAIARQMIAGGISFIIAWDGTSTPTVANIPAGVVVVYNDVSYTGTLSTAAAEAGAFYLVKSSTQTGTLDVYDEYVIAGPSGSKFWEKIGDTQLDLSSLGTLAYKDSVTLAKGNGRNVLGSDTTFTATASSVSFSGGSTDSVLGADTTFSVTQPTISLGGTTKYLSAAASGGGAAWNSKDQKTVVTEYASPTTETFVKSVSAETTNKLVTTTIYGVASSSQTGTLISDKVDKKLTTTTVPNVTSAGSASTWSFAMGTGVDAETLIISGANSTAPTLGTAITCATGGLSDTSATTNVGGEVVSSFTATAKSFAVKAAGSGTTVATGSVSSEGTGAAVVTGVTIGDSASAITGLGTASTVSVIGASSTFTNTQPTITLTANGSTGTGRITYLQSASPTASGAAVAANNNDTVTAVTDIGTGTASAQTVTHNADDYVKAPKWGDLSVTVS